MTDDGKLYDCKSFHYQLFKGSSESITPKSLLWRYMTFEKFCWLIETSKLYHPRLDQFNDPFEGAVTDAYARLRDTGVTEPYFSTKEWEPLIFKLLRYRSYATCWHASEHESDAHSQLYASGGAGIAIVSTMERLKNSVDFSPHLDGLLGQVEYVDFQNHNMRIRPYGTVVRPGHLKRQGFEHEREVRGIILGELNEAQLTRDDAYLAKIKAKMPLGVDAKVNLTELLQAIVISPVAPSFVAELVLMTTKRSGLDQLVRKSSLCGTPAY